MIFRRRRNAAPQPSRQTRRGPEKGRQVTTTEQARSRYWLTAKGYRAIGVTPPPCVLETDRELGLEPRE